jgi:hypothetical protein
MKPHTALAIVLLLLAGSRSLAQEWAKKMFDRTSHDFGVVAKGAKVQCVFNVENIYVEDAHIDFVTSNCQCTSAQISKPWLKTWEKAQITVVVDTRKYTGRRDATLRVKFDKPFEGEMQLQVQCFIRGDIVIKPEVVQFGSVPQGKGFRQKVTVQYAGRADWKIEKIECNNEHLAGQAVEIGRVPDPATHATHVTYELLVTLKGDTPPGYVQDVLYLVTNDPNAQTARIPVAVEGSVTAPLQARPSPLMMGLVDAGQTRTDKLVVQGQTPFRIVGVRCDDPRFKVTLPEGAAKTWHVILVTFTADATPGKVNGKVRIETDQGAAASVEVPVQVQIVPKPLGPEGG